MLLLFCSMLSLHSNAFNCPFPPVTSLPVQQLLLSGNAFNCTIPEAIGDLAPTLTILDLSQNSFAGSIPGGLASLTRLTYAPGCTCARCVCVCVGGWLAGCVCARDVCVVCVCVCAVACLFCCIVFSEFTLVCACGKGRNVGVCVCVPRTQCVATKQQHFHGFASRDHGEHGIAAVSVLSL